MAKQPPTRLLARLAAERATRDGAPDAAPPTDAAAPQSPATSSSPPSASPNGPRATDSTAPADANASGQPRGIARAAPLAQRRPAGLTTGRALWLLVLGGTTAITLRQPDIVADWLPALTPTITFAALCHVASVAALVILAPAISHAVRTARTPQRSPMRTLLDSGWRAGQEAVVALALAMPWMLCAIAIAPVSDALVLRSLALVSTVTLAAGTWGAALGLLRPGAVAWWTLAVALLLAGVPAFAFGMFEYGGGWPGWTSLVHPNVALQAGDHAFGAAAQVEATIAWLACALLGVLASVIAAVANARHARGAAASKARRNAPPIALLVLVATAVLATADRPARAQLPSSDSDSTELRARWLCEPFADVDAIQPLVVEWDGDLPPRGWIEVASARGRWLTRWPLAARATVPALIAAEDAHAVVSILDERATPLAQIDVAPPARSLWIPRPDGERGPASMRLRLALLVRRSALGGPTVLAGERTVGVTVAANDLPVTLAGLQVADAIVLGDVRTTDLDTRQLAALRTWTSAGGTLVIANPSDSARRDLLAELELKPTIDNALATSAAPHAVGLGHVIVADAFARALDPTDALESVLTSAPARPRRAPTARPVIVPTDMLPLRTAHGPRGSSRTTDAAFAIALSWLVVIGVVLIWLRWRGRESVVARAALVGVCGLAAAVAALAMPTRPIAREEVVIVHLPATGAASGRATAYLRVAPVKAGPVTIELDGDTVPTPLLMSEQWPSVTITASWFAPADSGVDGGRWIVDFGMVSANRARLLRVDAPLGARATRNHGWFGGIELGIDPDTGTAQIINRTGQRLATPIYVDGFRAYALNTLERDAVHTVRLDGGARWRDVLFNLTRADVHNASDSADSAERDRLAAAIRANVGYGRRFLAARAEAPIADWTATPFARDHRFPPIVIVSAD